MKTLYVSDLDGTLLRRDKTVSDFTVNTINELTEQGMLFSYATARSYVSAGRMTSGITAHIPVIIYNGAFILENGTQKQLLFEYLPHDDAHRVLDTLLAHDIYPIVYAMVDGVEKYTHCPRLESQAAKTFEDGRPGDVRANPVDDPAELYRGEIFNITCIDDSEKMRPLYEQMKDKYQCLWFTDIYTGNRWFEILPPRATKANAILRLKEMLGCDRVVCFGDAENDVSMFRIADECYAMENAVDELKAIATGVIGSNEEDGVACFLLNRYHKEGKNNHEM